MKPGPALDELVARVENTLQAQFVHAISRQTKKVVVGTRVVAPPYSTDIATAWRLKPRLEPGFTLVELAPDQWAARANGRTAHGDTAPHAMCLLFLDLKARRRSGVGAPDVSPDLS